ncbi:MAG: RDD family protein [Planctomycetota bacterium]|nr:RDD family protein [Planctomycetota bacterium]
MAGQPDAVYFHDEDYAPIGRRIGAFLLDHVFLFIMLIVIEMAVFTASTAFAPPDLQVRLADTDPIERKKAINDWLASDEGMAWIFNAFYAWLVFGVVYYIVFRRLRGGTLGYRIAGIRLVDKTGSSPSFARLTGRFVFAAIVTFPLGVSYGLCLTDRRRQSFHDRWCGTWMVRKRALPAGPAATEHAGFVLGSYMFNYPVMEPVSSDDSDENQPNK